jgi:hypothetical protein
MAVIFKDILTQWCGTYNSLIGPETYSWQWKTYLWWWRHFLLLQDLLASCKSMSVRPTLSCSSSGKQYIKDKNWNSWKVGKFRLWRWRVAWTCQDHAQWWLFILPMLVLLPETVSELVSYSFRYSLYPCYVVSGKLQSEPEVHSTDLYCSNKNLSNTKSATRNMKVIHNKSILLLYAYQRSITHSL